MTRPTVFWVGIAVVAIVMLVLLHQILMPFVLGMLTAYLLVPILDGLRRAGLNRSFAAVMLVSLLLVAFVAIILVIMPFLIAELRFFIGVLPGLCHPRPVAAHRREPKLAAEHCSAMISGSSNRPSIS